MAGEAVDPEAAIRAARPPSGAARLAAAARAATLSVEGVVDTVAGRHGVWSTPDRGDAIPGVVAAALGGDRYELALHLVAEPVPLHPLAHRVRERVRAEADRALPGVRLGSIEVAFEAVVGEPLAAPTRGRRSRSPTPSVPSGALPGEAAER